MCCPECGHTIFRGAKRCNNVQDRCRSGLILKENHLKPMTEKSEKSLSQKRMPCSGWTVMVDGTTSTGNSSTRKLWPISTGSSVTMQTATLSARCGDDMVEKVYFSYQETALFAVDIIQNDDLHLLLNTQKQIPLNPEKLFIRNDTLFMHFENQIIKFTGRSMIKLSDRL